MSDGPYVEQCSACGYIHPPPTGQFCKVVKLRNSKNSEKTSDILELTNWLEIELEKSKNYKPLIIAIKKLVDMKNKK